MSEEELFENFERGVTLLDTVRPSWYRSVNPETLIMESTCLCVLGQLYGNFYEAEQELGLTAPWRYGFDGDADGHDFTRLNKLWRDEIISRLSRGDAMVKLNADRALAQ